MPRILIFQVTGMTCKSCEHLVNDALKDIPGVIETEVSVKRKKVAFRLQDEAKDPDIVFINQKLSPHGYQMYPEGCAITERRADPFHKRLRRTLPAILLVGIALLFLSPLRKIVPTASASASIGALFLLGIVASVSTCLASTGGFMLAYSSEAGSKRKTLLMHLGRCGAFVIGGAILGAIGGALPTGSAIWYGTLGIVLGIGFFFVALNLLDLSPSLASLGITLPSSATGFADRIRKRPGSITPLLVGAVTFILPCGFTQTAQALALASGSWSNGTVLLLAFALGTLPVLLGVTTIASKASLQHQTLRLAMGAILLFFALGQIHAGLTVFGVPLTFTTATIGAVADGDVQVVNMNVTSYGYAPNSFTLKKDVPVRWEINATDVSGCTNSIVSRDLNINRRLTQGKNLITFTPHKTGTIAFSCSMGMVRGTFNVM